MIIDDFIAYKRNTLTDSICVESVITDFYSRLYFYMIFLENTKRSEESDLIKNVMGLLINCRSTIDRTYEQVSEVLEKVSVYLNIQFTVLSRSKECNWETIVFTTYMQDLSTAISFFRNEIKAEEV